MIKGINHHVIELTETGNKYYEKALLIVKPEYSQSNEMFLQKEARKMMKDLKAPSAIKHKQNLLMRFLKFGCAAAAGSIITTLLTYTNM